MRVLLESSSFEKKNFVLSGKGRVSNWEPCDAWGWKRGRQGNCQGRNFSFLILQFWIMAGGCVYTKLLLHLCTQPLAQKLYCTWSVFKLECQVFELKASRSSSNKSPQPSVFSFFIFFIKSVSLPPLLEEYGRKKNGGKEDVQHQSFLSVNKWRDFSHFTPFLGTLLFMELLELCCPAW